MKALIPSFQGMPLTVEHFVEDVVLDQRSRSFFARRMADCQGNRFQRDAHHRHLTRNGAPQIVRGEMRNGKAIPAITQV